MEHPFKPVPDPEFSFIRFYMNIRGLLTNRVHEDLVHEAHHGGVHFSGFGGGWRRCFRRQILKTRILVEVSKF